jgi:branched-chain amino acid transport system substrate-binding protein
MMYRTRLTGVIAAVVAASVGLAACSSSSSGGGAGPTSTSGAGGTAPTAGGDSSVTLSGAPIKIGFAVDITGGQAPEDAGAPKIAAAWQSWVNATGGIGGRPVNVVTIDTKGDAATAQAAVKTLVETDKVSAVITEDDAVEGEMQPYLTAHNIPVVGAVGSNVKLWGQTPNYLDIATQAETAYHYGPASIGQQEGKKKFGIIVCAEIAACQLAVPLFKQAAQHYGFQFVGDATAAASAPNYAAQCLSLINKGVDVLYVGVIASVMIRIVQSCQQQGYTGDIGIESGTFNLNEINKVTPANYIGNIASFPWWSTAAPVVQYRDVVQKYAPGAFYQNQQSTALWAALQLFKKAIGTPKGTLTPAMVTQDYDNLRGETLDGLLPQPISFRAGKPSPPIECYWNFKYHTGDKNPTTILIGKSGNGATGDLASSCAPITGY